MQGVPRAQDPLPAIYTGCGHGHCQLLKKGLENLDTTRLFDNGAREDVIHINHPEQTPAGYLLLSSIHHAPELQGMALYGATELSGWQLRENNEFSGMCRAQPQHTSVN